MSELVSMKLSKRDAAAMKEPSTLATDGPEYPWGLSLSLDNDSLKKLGLSADDFSTGTQMGIIAKVEVKRVSSEDVDGDEPRESVTLQITALCVEDDAASAGKAAGALYGEKA